MGNGSLPLRGSGTADVDDSTSPLYLIVAIPDDNSPAVLVSILTQYQLPR